ncbi:hypothetical protein [Marinomonas fungiae]|uniref:hypothetical protein n=1 Tax=Marinomonas fungiae TaxID=1137284 RepID=UPI003A90C493
MVSSWRSKGLLIGVLGISQVACSERNITTRLGDTNICIPNHFMVNLGSGSSSPDDYDEAPPIYESISIDPPYVQQEVPAYQGYGGDKTFPRYDALHVTITRYKPYQYEIPTADEYDHFFLR